MESESESASLSFLSCPQHQAHAAARAVALLLGDLVPMLPENPVTPQAPDDDVR